LREQKDINLLSTHVAFQHHECIDGTGYPRSLKKADICEFARIVAIADRFDALTSERRHRKSHSYSAAIELMKTETGKRVDPDLTDIFLKNIAIYPTGSLVELNTGEIGVVAGNNRPETSRPVIRILTDKSKRVQANRNYLEVDLRNEKELRVLRIVEDDTIPSYLHKIFEEQKTAVPAGLMAQANA
ncbi:MAG: HD-GYP domain-containing protein, partial [Eubacteriales bacterium]